MSSYDFKTLSDQDFEELVCDLMEKELGVPLQIFSKGRDKGIDLRHSFQGSEASIVVQCKHYAGSTAAQLLSSAKDERAKLDKLNNPGLRYYFVTSLPLSVGMVDKLTTLFSPYVQSAHQIINCKKLNQLLDKNRGIEEKHFKLWLTSTGVLERIVKAKLHTQKFLTLEEIRRSYQRFVPIPALSDALNKLEDHRHVIISGIPGVGKTTLAHVLVAKYVDKGFSAVSLSGALEKLLDVLSHDPEDPQIIMYDDFLGESALQITFDGAAAALLERIINSLRKRPNLRLVFTTREYILGKAQELSERLARLSQSSVLVKSVVSIAGLRYQQKAHIFYNHLYYAELPRPHLRRLIEERIYDYVCRHQNFNPRLIEGVCNSRTAEKMSAEEYVRYVRESFDNPSALWEHAFLRQLDDSCRLICFLLVSLGSTTKKQALKTAFSEAMKADNRQVTDFQFAQALRILEGTFVITGKIRDSEEIGAQFHNPSVKDFVVTCLADSPLAIDFLIRGAHLFSQLHNLLNHRDTSNGFAFRQMLKSQSQAVMSKAYVLATQSLIRIIGTDVRIGGGYLIFSTRQTLLERAQQLIEMHEALGYRVTEGNLAVLVSMVNKAEAPSIYQLAADYQRLASAIGSAERAGVLVDSSLGELVVLRSLEAAAESPSIYTLNSASKVVRSLDRRGNDPARIIKWEVFEEYFYGLSASDFDDGDEIVFAINVAEAFGEVLERDVEAIVEHLEEIHAEIPEEDDRPTTLERRDYFPEPEVFDVESAFRSLLPEE